MAHAADDIKAFWLTASITTPEPSEMLLDDDTDRNDATSGVRRRAPRLRNSLGGSTAPRVGGRREHSRGNANGYDGDIRGRHFCRVAAGALCVAARPRSRRAPADAASARACAAGVSRLGLRTVLKAGAGCGCLSFPLSNPAVRPRRISFTDTGSSIRFVGGLAWRRYAFSNLPGRSRSACRPGRGRGPHTPSIFCQSSSLRA